MEEDKQNTDRADILHQKEIEMEETSTKSSPVGKLVAHYLVGYEPANEDAGEETYHRQENLARYEVKPVEKTLSEKH